MEYITIWKIVYKCHVSLEDIEKYWTYDRMVAFESFSNMMNDYKSAWSEHYRMESSRERRNG